MPLPHQYPGAPEDTDILYGIHTVAEALKNQKRKHVQMLATKNGIQRLAAEIAGAGMIPEEVQPRQLDKFTGRAAIHQGVLLISKSLRQPRLDEIPRHGIIVILDQVTDPHNVGAIIRTCAAFAAIALITTARHSPEASGTLLKAASGAYEHVPMVKVTNLRRAMDELRFHGFTVLGLDSGAVDTLVKPAAPAPVVIVLGAEGKGLRQLTRQTCDRLVRLEMPGEIKSLNVSNAAAIALYELTRV